MKNLLQPLVIVLTIAASVAAAPSRNLMSPLGDSNMGYPLGIFNDPFDSSQLPREEIMKLRRNLDRIGGGNLLRNLDRIGGAHLLREAQEPEKSDSSRLPNGAKVSDENSGLFTGGRQFVIDPKDVQSWYDDHPGGDLLTDSQFGKDHKFPWIQNFRATNDRIYPSAREFLPYFNEAGQANKHQQGQSLKNSAVQSVQQRNLDHIGGGNLLRDVGDLQDYRTLSDDRENALYDSEISNYRPRQDNSLVRYERTGLDSLSGATFGQSKKYDPSTRFPKTGTTYLKPGEYFRILAGVLPKRNFDEIDRTNFDSFVKKNDIKIPKQVASHTGGKGNFDEIDYGFNGAINTN
ncbi:uncharacterized protein [Venturia canescens]|uniref:uncharacterized protein n=1 Tax=Venturia canescens TaxID=32260 RepID=UPI001C9C0CD1|nr:uncharacterized protein LOC122407980 [Venturia canescens]